MIFTKLRLHGFKSFVDASEFLIEPGLTGIVGPNGCGKSNLVEALRWVMGESSYKNMRASGMDDVIFSGSGNRPARNIAEVSLTIDNSARGAPAAFNSFDLLEVTRRIEREAGSIYRVNGREVRARDVQLLFADASSGARSPAMVRQGQIGEIISAKPQARRRILEEAAGVAGLYSRRHEAELRLKAAEDNLLRLDDVLRQIEAQIGSLGSQAVQAAKYRELSAQIRRAEALVLWLTWQEAEQARLQAQQQAQQAQGAVQERMQAQARAARDQALAAAALPALREAEAKAGAAVQRLVLARQELDAQERRAKDRVADLARSIAQFEHDSAREAGQIEDAQAMLARLAEELAALQASAAGAQAMAAQRAEAHAQSAQAALEGEQKHAALQQDLATHRAASDMQRNRVKEAEQRASRLRNDCARLDQEAAQLAASAANTARLATLRAELAEAQAARAAQEGALTQQEQALISLRQQDLQARGPLQDAERRAQRLETEARTLEKLLARPLGQSFVAVLEAITIQKGYEAALGAALGDDLDASLDARAPTHWQESEGDGPPLPEGATPLLAFATVPAALRRRLAQVGVVERGHGADMRRLLAQGQRLVSREGNLWRWDGLTQAAEAPSAATRRLQEKNRLAAIQVEAETARSALAGLTAQMSALSTAIRTASEAELAARNQMRALTHAAEARSEALLRFERQQAQDEAKRAALAQSRERLLNDLREAEGALHEAQAALDALGAPTLLQQALDAARDAARALRQKEAEARAALHDHQRAEEARQARVAQIQRDSADWQARGARARSHHEDLQSRLEGARAEHRQLSEAPDHFFAQRRALSLEIESAEAALLDANAARGEGESALSAADRMARQALEAMSGAREELARSEARLEAGKARLAELDHMIREGLDCAPSALPALAGLTQGPGSSSAAQQDVRSAERALSSLRASRERLGAVNLRADTELAEAQGRKTSLESERADLTEAIRRLRLAIQNLNREGRQRLLAAFAQVNEHFKALFSSLFGGGEAELQLVESDDPLEAGLEIMARPPGKKPQTMTLLSGGEQALTALSLIFAIFLTNPSPICVLDEVDAPLDDANVERFCDLLDEMTRRTQTRFITITHNPITMARMKRLFGVTMAERGVSQLVSVDLETAERFLEAS